MKKTLEKMKKENDAPLDQEYIPEMGENETLKDFFDKLNAKEKEYKAGITSGDDLLDKAFNVALNRQFKKKK
jgi:hypothetical protein